MEKEPPSFNSSDENGDYQRKKITLPGGRIIEILYLITGKSPFASAPQEPEAHREDLHICTSCDSNLVYPYRWEEKENDIWHVCLRCPNCEHYREGEFDLDAVQAFDDVLNDGSEELLQEVKELSKENMKQYAERFLGALAADAIQPMDFASTTRFWLDKYPPGGADSHPAW